MYPSELKEFAPRPTLTIRLQTPAQELPHHLKRIYQAIADYACAIDEELTGPAFTIYYNMDMQNLDIEAGFVVSEQLPEQGEIQSRTIPAGTYAICHYTGPYGELGPAYDSLTQFVAEKGYVPSGVAYEFYLNGPNEVAPQDLKTDIMFPVTRVEEKETI